MPIVIRELADGTNVDGVLLVREAEVAQTKKGEDFLKLVLADRTGNVDGRIWDGLDETVRATCQPGSAVRLLGHYKIDDYGGQITVGQVNAGAAIRPARDEEIDWDKLLEGPAEPVEQIEERFRRILATVKDEHLRWLLDAVFSPATTTWERFRLAPAAKGVHEAYRHGLLEHTCRVAKMVVSLAAITNVDYNLAVTAALLHDIGKLDVYYPDPLAIGVTTTGRLEGEVTRSYYFLRRLMEDVPDFPADTAQALLHIVLSHHGTLEHGAAVEPKTREAILIHHVDNLCAKLGVMDRLERGKRDGEEWVRDRRTRTEAYFPANP